MRSSLHRIVLLSLCFSMPQMFAFAQVQTGVPQFGTFSSGGPDVINIGNLNVMLDIPVINKPGRGLPFSYDLVFNSSIWYPVTSGGNTVWTPVSQWGWSGLSPAGAAQISYNVV